MCVLFGRECVCRFGGGTWRRGLYCELSVEVLVVGCGGEGMEVVRWK